MPAEPVPPGMTPRPPFLRFADKKDDDVPFASFIDEGDCDIEKGSYYMLCRTFFLIRHDLPPDASSEYLLHKSWLHALVIADISI